MKRRSLTRLIVFAALLAAAVLAWRYTGCDVSYF